MARLRKRITKFKADRQRIINTGRKKLSNEIIKFYISELVLAKAKILEDSMREKEQEFSIPDQIVFASLRESASREITGIFQWIREYLVYAIDSEVGLQAETSKKKNLELTSFRCPDEDHGTEYQDLFLIYASQKEIVNYLAKAITRFKQKGWSAGFGGEKWPQIATIAKEMWETETIAEMCVLVDRAFQAEHNGGMTFDKRGDLIFSQENFDKKTLDINRDCTDTAKLLSQFRKRATTIKTKTFIKKLISMLRVVESCKKKSALRGE